MLMSHPTRGSAPPISNHYNREDNGVTKRITKLNYHLNGERAILKKLKTCDRPTEMVEKPGRNFVIELSTAGFEAFRAIILMNVHLPKDSVWTSRHFDYETKVDGSDNITQDVLRIKSWQALFPNLAQGRTGSLSASINLYRTTCRALINGRDSEALASAVNSFLCYISTEPEIRIQNRHLKTSLNTILSNNAQKMEKNPSHEDNNTLDLECDNERHVETTSKHTSRRESMSKIPVPTSKSPKSAYKTTPKTTPSAPPKTPKHVNINEVVSYDADRVLYDMSLDQEASDENTKTDKKAKVNTDTHSNEQTGPTKVRPSKDQSTEIIDREKDKKQKSDEETLKTKNNRMEKQLIVILPPEKDNKQLGRSLNRPTNDTPTAVETVNAKMLDDEREKQLKKKEKLLEKREAAIQRTEMELGERTQEIAALKSLVSQLEEKMKTVEDENKFLKIQIHAQPNTNSDEKKETHEPKQMKSYNHDILTTQLMSTVASLTQTMAALTLRVDTLAGKNNGQTREGGNEESQLAINGSKMSTPQGNNYQANREHARTQEITDEKQNKREYEILFENEAYDIPNNYLPHSLIFSRPKMQQSNTSNDETTSKQAINAASYFDPSRKVLGYNNNSQAYTNTMLQQKRPSQGRKRTGGYRNGTRTFWNSNADIKDQKPEPHKQIDTGHPDTKRNIGTNHSEESATDHKTSHTPKMESEDVVNTKFVNDLIHLDEDYSSEIPKNSPNTEDADLIDLISLLPEPNYRKSLATPENAHSNTPENSSSFLGSSPLKKGPDIAHS